ncbi:hypothetical protein PIB30_094805 [Stylosanthes scabra]|uniref:Uncharacterized protein n=1 Tax=Stylosanthes scabra TaxID=79078 RepID=A0ABU6ZU69_9FABA|nr:hypothetical protein [Stylosanthes scabra]
MRVLRRPRELPRVVRFCVFAVSPACVAVVGLKLCLATRQLIKFGACQTYAILIDSDDYLLLVYHFGYASSSEDLQFPTENGKKHLSEEEMKLKTWREIAALGMQLGKMNIAAWASNDEEEKKQSAARDANTEEHERIEFEKRVLNGRKLRSLNILQGLFSTHIIII